jgi:hypothetical protein
MLTAEPKQRDNLPATKKMLPSKGKKNPPATKEMPTPKGKKDLPATKTHPIPPQTMYADPIKGADD